MNTVSEAKSARRPKTVRPAHVSIRPKALNLHVGACTPTAWFGDNPVLSNVLAAFKATFPRGERWMIKTVREFRDQVRDDPKLCREISGFIGQEGHHATEHAVFNDWLAARGARMDDVDGTVKWCLDFFDRHSPEQRLAIVGGAEHLTALFGALVLSHPEILEKVHPDFRALWVWHSMEEIQHKAVTYDLYETIDGGYARRAYGYSLLTGLFVVMTALAGVRLSIADRSLFKPRATAGALWWLFGFGKGAGYVRKDMLPRLLEFYRPGFHPWDRDDSHLLAQWQPVLDRMQADRAASRH